jgi:small-conductance mechanosensitive channel
LNFAVRFYLASLDNRFSTINEIHNAIAERFAKEHIEIAFPQMDVHVKSDLPDASPN